MAVHRTRAPLAAVRLATALAADAAAGDGPKWQQIALEGDYKGYSGGEMPFKLTKDTFASIVANFRAHPWFKAGPDGKGCADVIPWDFHHASECEPTSGTIPSQGAPAQGWVLDLEVRTDANGVSSLWALTRWLEPAKTYIRNGQYRSASVAVALNAIDPQTAKPIGPLLTSVALTNQPFIEGMADLAASFFHLAKGATGMDIKKIREFLVSMGDSIDQMVEAIDAGDATEDAPAGPAAAVAGRQPPGKRADVVNLAEYPGANDTERAVNAFRATVKGAESMAYDDVFELACEARRTGRFVNLSAGARR